MINFRLAEYDLETGKFKRFLELGKDFLYARDFILIDEGLDCFKRYENADFKSICPDVFHVDAKKDPLNRFNGLFNGRTYGEGRFVLSKYMRIIGIDSNEVFEDDVLGFKGYVLGNVHENPELWNKAK